LRGEADGIRTRNPRIDSPVRYFSVFFFDLGPRYALRRKRTMSVGSLECPPQA
jgi:hypothetical protein